MVSSTHPYYRKRARGPYHVVRRHSDGNSVDLRYVHLPYGDLNTVAQAVLCFDARAGEFVRAATGALPKRDKYEFLEMRDYLDVAPTIFIPRANCLAALAYPDFFPYDRAAAGLRDMVSDALLASSAGWCGSIGPGVHDAPTLIALEGNVAEGNYDLSQMHLIPMAYRHYDDLTPEAREYLINVLLQRGRIHRVDEDDTFTSGQVPNDWSRAGHVSPGGYKIRIGETENHILQIHTARYLTNQLLYQRTGDFRNDNRRNAMDDSRSCTDLMLELLRNFLRDDFSEYNAKSYQHETRTALLNLCSYAYDDTVRLGARMVLDYLSARVVVSSCDLRRLVPFRRRNVDTNSQLIHNTRFMDVSLLEWATGCDPNTEHFAVQAGNLRAYETVTPLEQTPWYDYEMAKAPHDTPHWRSHAWAVLGIAPERGVTGENGVTEAVSDYRLPPSIHDLFINDRNRRFFQRLHRKVRPDVESGQNADNMEIYAGSPSYLISAGGSLAGPAIDPDVQGLFDHKSVLKQVGVAVTTSFMPTGQSAGPGTQNYARDLIQFSSFSEEGFDVENYGVAPDFACGHVVHLPDWCAPASPHRLFSFVDKGNGADRPGFYLAFLRDGDFTVMEAYDTWLHPDLSYDDFKNKVYEKNKDVRLRNAEQASYTTVNGNRIRFSIWYFDDVDFGARVHSIEYGTTDWNDRIGDAGNVTWPLLNGTILNSTVEGIIEIANPGLNTRITLDWSDAAHPKRISENGKIESAGNNEEVWVDFAWTGPQEGDFFYPFKTIAGAAAAVSPGGAIKIRPGSTRERPHLDHRKKIRLEAALGGVAIGIR